MRVVHRKTVPKVVDSKPGRTTRRGSTPKNSDNAAELPTIERQRPGRGYRHLLLKRDVERFVKLLPDWKQLLVGLNSIVLAPGSRRREGFCTFNELAITAWERELWVERDPYYFEDHRQILERLGVPCELTKDGDYLCKFTESTARAYQLLHIFLHELGHHHDRMTTKSKRDSSRGEEYAEQYAIDYANRIWNRYLNEFGLP